MLEKVHVRKSVKFRKEVQVQGQERQGQEVTCEYSSASSSCHVSSSYFSSSSISASASVKEKEGETIASAAAEGILKGRLAQSEDGLLASWVRTRERNQWVTKSEYAELIDSLLKISEPSLQKSLCLTLLNPNYLSVLWARPRELFALNPKDEDDKTPSNSQSRQESIVNQALGCNPPMNEELAFWRRLREKLSKLNPETTTNVSTLPNMEFSPECVQIMPPFAGVLPQGVPSEEGFLDIWKDSSDFQNWISETYRAHVEIYGQIIEEERKKSRSESEGDSKVSSQNSSFTSISSASKTSSHSSCYESSESSAYDSMSYSKSSKSNHSSRSFDTSDSHRSFYNSWSSSHQFELIQEIVLAIANFGSIKWEQIDSDVIPEVLFIYLEIYRHRRLIDEDSFERLKYLITQVSSQASGSQLEEQKTWNRLREMNIANQAVPETESQSKGTSLKLSTANFVPNPTSAIAREQNPEDYMRTREIFSEIFVECIHESQKPDKNVNRKLFADLTNCIKLARALDANLDLELVWQKLTESEENLMTFRKNGNNDNEFNDGENSRNDDLKKYHLEISRMSKSVNNFAERRSSRYSVFGRSETRHFTYHEVENKLKRKIRNYGDRFNDDGNHISDDDESYRKTSVSSSSVERKVSLKVNKNEKRSKSLTSDAEYVLKHTVLSGAGLSKEISWLRLRENVRDVVTGAIKASHSLENDKENKLKSSSVNSIQDFILAVASFGFIDWRSVDPESIPAVLMFYAQLIANEKGLEQNMELLKCLINNIKCTGFGSECETSDWIRTREMTSLKDSEPLVNVGASKMDANLNKTKVNLESSLACGLEQVPQTYMRTRETAEPQVKTAVSEVDFVPGSSTHLLSTLNRKQTVLGKATGQSFNWEDIPVCFDEAVKSVGDVSKQVANGLSLTFESLGEVAKFLAMASFAFINWSTVDEQAIPAVLLFYAQLVQQKSTLGKDFEHLRFWLEKVITQSLGTESSVMPWIRPREMIITCAEVADSFNQPKITSGLQKRPKFQQNLVVGKGLAQPPEVYGRVRELVSTETIECEQNLSRGFQKVFMADLIECIKVARAIDATVDGPDNWLNAAILDGKALNETRKKILAKQLSANEKSLESCKPCRNNSLGRNALGCISYEETQAKQTRIVQTKANGTQIKNVCSLNGKRVLSKLLAAGSSHILSLLEAKNVDAAKKGSIEAFKSLIGQNCDLKPEQLRASSLAKAKNGSLELMQTLELNRNNFQSDGETEKVKAVENAEDSNYELDYEEWIYAILASALLAKIEMSSLDDELFFDCESGPFKADPLWEDNQLETGEESRKKVLSVGKELDDIQYDKVDAEACLKHVLEKKAFVSNYSAPKFQENEFKKRSLKREKLARNALGCIKYEETKEKQTRIIQTNAFKTLIEEKCNLGSEIKKVYLLAKGNQMLLDILECEDFENGNFKNVFKNVLEIVEGGFLSLASNENKIEDSEVLSTVENCYDQLTEALGMIEPEKFSMLVGGIEKVETFKAHEERQQPADDLILAEDLSLDVLEIPKDIESSDEESEDELLVPETKPEVQNPNRPLPADDDESEDELVIPETKPIVENPAHSLPVNLLFRDSKPADEEEHFQEKLAPIRLECESQASFELQDEVDGVTMQDIPQAIFEVRAEVPVAYDRKADKYIYDVVSKSFKVDPAVINNMTVKVTRDQKEECFERVLMDHLDQIVAPTAKMNICVSRQHTSEQSATRIESFGSEKSSEQREELNLSGIQTDGSIEEKGGRYVYCSATKSFKVDAAAINTMMVKVSRDAEYSHLEGLETSALITRDESNVAPPTSKLDAFITRNHVTSHAQSAEEKWIGGIDMEMEVFRMEVTQEESYEHDSMEN